jgi:malonyl CoA-acyl carrier protein transacylase
MNDSNLASTPTHQHEAAEPIALVGMGGCFPDAENIPTFWKNICAGHVAIKEVPRERWNPELYYHAERGQKDKTYSKIGAFIESIPFERKLFRIPPRTLEVIDPIQKLALTAVHQAFSDAGLEPFSGGEGRAFNRERCAVIIGNSMGGEYNGRSIHRAYFPEVLQALTTTSAWQDLNQAEREHLSDEFEQAYKASTPEITEDTMPGELANCIAGRIANVFDLCGHNFTTDAACASSLAAVQAAVHTLRAGEVDVVVAGGTDSQMDPPSFIKFSQIGALSAELSAPFDARASGFVMGEGVGMLVLKRLRDAVADGDRIYAQILGIGCASDGKGKGITAPNPRGQRLAITRAYEQAAVPIESVGLFEAHGTSTPVGDGVEVAVLSECLKNSGTSQREIPIGSIKSMIGHLKSAAGVAALIKTSLAIYHRTLPPSANFKAPPPNSLLSEGYLKVNTQTREWNDEADARRAGVSAFGFGGTNFHVVLEESGARSTSNHIVRHTDSKASYEVKSVQSGASAGNEQILTEITQLFAEQTGYDVEDLDPEYQLEADLGIDTVKQAEIFGLIREKYNLAQEQEFSLAETSTLKAIVDYVVTRSTGEGGGSASTEPSIEVLPPNVPSIGPRVLSFGGRDKAALFEEAHKKLAACESIEDFVGNNNETTEESCRLAFVAEDLEAAKSALGTAETKRARMLAARGIFLSENPGLSQSGKIAFLFPGQGSQYLCMFEDLAERYPVVADTFAEANRILEPLIGQCLTDIVWTHADDEESKARANAALKQTEITQPAMLTADVAMFRLLAEYGVKPDMVAGHSLGEYGACVAGGVLSFADALYAVSARGREMAGVEVPDTGKMASISGPVTKVDEVLAGVPGYVIAANKNCPTQTVIAGESQAVEIAVKEFAALGIDAQEIPVSHAFHSKIVAPASEPLARVLSGLDIQAPTLPILSNVHADYYPKEKDEIVKLLAKQLESPVEYIAQIERMYAEGARLFVEVGPRRASTGFVRSILGKAEYVAVATNHPKKPGVDCFLEALACLVSEGYGVRDPEAAGVIEDSPVSMPSHAQKVQAAQKDSGASAMQHAGGENASEDAIWISGISVLAPKAQPVEPMGVDAFAELLNGHNFIESVHESKKQEVLDKNVTRLNKANGVFEPLKALSEVLQLFASVGDIDLAADYGVDEGFVDALDKTSHLAIATGIDALRDAGLPLHRYYRTTSTGKRLADRWGLPPRLAKRTGIVFASAFPGLDRLIDDVSQHVASQFRGNLSQMLARVQDGLEKIPLEPSHRTAVRELFSEHLDVLSEDKNPYEFSRKFLFRILSMGHAQLAQVICAQGPNTQINGACASGPQALAIAEDWLRLGRCDRVVIVSADDVANETMFPWIGAGFLAAGAATVESDVQKAAVPFGTHRNGMILGSGASAFVVERAGSVQERGLNGIVELLATTMVNSAFHGTRLDAEFIKEAFDDVIKKVENKTGSKRIDFASRCFFMSHETYTPARGGSSAAEIEALRFAFGEAANQVLIANTKGYTGHPMGASLEDVVAIKGLQRQVLPAIANLHDVDPDFADLNFAQGGEIDAAYAFRFSAGFGSQIAISAYGKLATQEERLLDPGKYQHWLNDISGREDAALEIVDRTLRISESGGLEAWELGVPSLVCVDFVSNAAEPSPAIQASAPREEPPEVKPVEPMPTLDAAGLLHEVQELFAEQTGYELEELEPEYQLEADLGIDTVKQAEIFGVLREQFNIPNEVTFDLASVQTLSAVVDFLMEQKTESTGTPPEPAPADATRDAESISEQPSEQPPGIEADANVLTEIQDLFAQETGYEIDELEPDYQLEADLGIDTVKQAEIFSVIRERYGIPNDVTFELSEIQTLRAISDFVAGHRHGDFVKATSASEADASPPAISVQPEAEPIASPSPSPSPQEVGSEELQKGDHLLLEIQKLFADETGYELEDLDPEHQLEADLGIDTVKQAEVFGVIRERYGLAQEENFDLGAIQTIAAVHTYIAGRLQGKEGRADPQPVSEGVAAEIVESRASKDIPETSHVANESLLEEMKELFAAQTGYSVDELDPDYELEADLGIDTVKQAEILGLVRQRYGFAQDENVQLSQIQTLNKLVDYVRQKTEDAPEDRAEQLDELSDVAPVSSVKESDSGQFGALKVQLEELPLILGAARTCRDRHVLLLSAEGDSRQIVLKAALESRGAKVRVCADFLSKAPESWEELVVDGEGHIADDLFVLIPENDDWSATGISAQTEAIFFLARAMARQSKDLSTKSIVVLGRSRGVLSHGPLSAQNLLLGGAAGIVKSIAKEWECKALALDLDFSLSIDDSFETALNEWLSDGPIEIGYIKGKRYTLKAREELSLETQSLSKNDLVVATGGARGVTFSLIYELAKRGPFRLIILGRTRAMAQSESPLGDLQAAEQKELARASLLSAGEKATPLNIRRWLEKEEQRLVVSNNIESLRKLGCEVETAICDVSKRDEVKDTIETISKRYGRVDLVLHGAGLEESKFIQDKDESAFARVFAPKAQAALILWEELQPKRMVCMGSVAGRFGNAAQVDYAAANNLMSALAGNGETHVLNIAWTAWGDVGMATRGSIRKVLEDAGVELLPVEVGARIGADLIASQVSGEVVVAGELGSFAPADDKLKEKVVPATDNIFFERIFEEAGKTIYSRHFDVKKDLGLDHHRINGVPVLPGVLGIELMAQAARQHFSQEIFELEDVEFKLPLKMFRDEPVEVCVEIVWHENRARVELTSVFQGPKKSMKREHFKATIILNAEPSLAPALPNFIDKEYSDITIQDAYKRYFHGPRFKVMKELLSWNKSSLISALVHDRPVWMDKIDHGDFCTLPLVREGAFQTAGLFEMVHYDRMALPAGVKKIVLRRQPEFTEAVYTFIRKNTEAGSGLNFDLWSLGSDGEIIDYMEGYQTAKLRDFSPEECFAKPKKEMPEDNHRWQLLNISEAKSVIEQGEDEILKLLSGGEKEIFDGFDKEKRRSEWLAGRMVLKRLVRELWFGMSGTILPYGDIIVYNDAAGTPHLDVVGAPELNRASISISHRDEIAVASCILDQGLRAGIDVEKIVEHHSSFMNTYFSAAEQKMIDSAEDSSWFINASWAVKEACLKALGIGATVDFRHIEVRFLGQHWQVELNGDARERSERLGVIGITTMVEQKQGYVVARVALTLSPNAIANG